MLENPFAPINQLLEDSGHFASGIEFKVDPPGRWLFYLRVGKKFKKVEYFAKEQLVRIYERKWLRYREVAAMPVHDEEQAAQVVQAIISG